MHLQPMASSPDSLISARDAIIGGGGGGHNVAVKQKVHDVAFFLHTHTDSEKKQTPYNAHPCSAIHVKSTWQGQRRQSGPARQKGGGKRVMFRG